MRRLSLAIIAVVLLAGLLLPSATYAQSSVNFYLGAFVPKGEDARDRQDVLWNDLDFLSFNVKDFTAATAGMEYVVGLGDSFDGALGVGISSRSVPSVYANYVNANGSEIEQSLTLRMVPFTATVRWLPLGRSAGIEPYIGAGMAIINYRYSESGQFVDFTDGSVFRDTYTGRGTATGPTVLGGVQVPIGSVSFGGEVRWQRALGSLPADQDFAGDKIDLGGVNYLATFRVRF